MSTPHRPRKRFGQHFLRDTQVISQIIQTIHPQPHDHMLEIGPGEGVITGYLLPSVHTLAAVEIDRDLAAHLQNKFPKLELHQQDILDFDIKILQPLANQLRIVGNLPYNISTPLLFHLFESLDAIKDMHFMLQKEVVLRLTAPVGDKHYNRLSVMCQYFCDADFLFEIPPQAFTPPPKVVSAFVRMTPKNPEISVKNLALFSQIVKNAFTYRRKTLTNSLKGVVDMITFKQLDISPTARAQELTVNDYVRISNALSPKPYDGIKTR